MTNYNIKPDKNYKNTVDGYIFTGQQVLNLLSLASPTIQAIFLLTIEETEELPTKPKSKYGV